MIFYLRNILNLNEKFAYSLIGKLRHIVLPVFNILLGIQEKLVQNKINSNLFDVRGKLLKTLPRVRKIELNEVLTDEEKQYILAKANKILQHEFEIFSVSIKFDESIDWDLDFNSGYRWKKGKLYSKYNQINLDDNSDVKFPRELSRCHHFLTLGEAYIITEDDNYTKEFINEVRDWIHENPYKRSINWGCAMDVAIRSSNWIYSLRMFIDSPLISDVFLGEILTSIYLHGRFIYENPEKNRSYNHNHYLSDLAGQILIGVLFKGIGVKETDSWREDGIFEFYKELRIQILPTGFSYERTTNYHRLVTELIIYTLVLFKNNQIEIPQDILYRSKKMIEAILNYSFNDGKAPAIGDQDSGRFLPFYNYNINFQRYLINIGCVLFEDSIFKYYSGENNIDILFLFGKEGIEKYKEIKPDYKELVSIPFSDAGFYIMRNCNVYLFINNSGLSHYNEVKGGTHTHSDLLSFVYSYKNVPFIIDPGTYVYSSNPKERLKFRSTAMHNTITVDNCNQNDLKENELWGFNRNAIPSEVNWETNEEVDIYEGTHTGYMRLQNSVRHSRKFELNKLNDTLTIIDKIESEGKHNIKCHFHFDEKVDVRIDKKVVYCKNKSETIKISFQLDTNEDFLVDLKKEYVSKGYNHKVIAAYVIVSFEFDKIVELETVINKA